MKKYIILSAFLFSSLVYARESKITANFQVINGLAKSSTYDPSYGVKVSHLDWKIKNIPVINLGYDYSIDNFEFSIKGKKNIKNNMKSGTMKDYDWYSVTRDELHDYDVKYKDFSTMEEAKTYAEEIERTKNVSLEYDEEDEDGNGLYAVYYEPDEKDKGILSNFSETKNYVKDIINLDFSTKYFIKKTDKFKFAPLAGLSYEKYNFYAVGPVKQYHYIPGLEPVYFVYGTSGQKGVEYKQRYITPYLGLTLQYSPTTTFDVSFALKGSAWGKSKDIDYHVLRNFSSAVKYKKVKFLNANLEFTYHLNENIDLNLEIENTNYFERKSSNKTVSVALKNTSYSLGFRYKF